MNKKILLAVILGLVLIGLIIIFFVLPTEPKSATPKAGIMVLLPSSGEEVSLPINIQGFVGGGDGWVGFEGQVGTVELVQNNVVLGTAVLQATGDWTVLPTNFEANITDSSINCADKTNCISSGYATLLFHNENPSGDSNKDKIFALPITFK